MKKIIKIEINEQEMTIQEAKELWEELNLIFKEEKNQPHPSWPSWPSWPRHELFKVWY